MRFTGVKSGMLVQLVEFSGVVVRAVWTNASVAGGTDAGGLLVREVGEEWEYNVHELSAILFYGAASSNKVEEWKMPLWKRRNEVSVAKPSRRSSPRIIYFSHTLSDATFRKVEMKV
jgi:hypothetical protein